ncbi:hypothetical protein BOTCAL_1056g00020 [Botryotinia calthae]|uniref:Uncharacterized protein n=1 Tax=Botryotinia calthae TaxID=38488 RepID=A0A4Y8CE26_9HELO|nr:hypothetical protein BOTCAL_1056g00020 [Botryotinia calthae]
MASEMSNNSAYESQEPLQPLHNNQSIYAAGLVLHPHRKWTYVRKNWKMQWIPDAENAVLKLWESYRPEDAITPAPVHEVRTSNQFLNFLEAQDEGDEVPANEYAHYCA